MSDYKSMSCKGINEGKVYGFLEKQLENKFEIRQTKWC